SGFLFFQAEDGIRDFHVTGVQTCALPIFRKTDRRPSATTVLTQFREGLRYVTGFGPIRSLMTLLALVSLLGMPFAVLMPVFANEDRKSVGEGKRAVRGGAAY